ncbi:ribonuclease M5 [Edaphobacillus lindanitolerans]|uniref:Ribonuclease M5 n=1 Tax=Edaphobacillus lindanitolerans TaxID=550447 RepID=A0A1U7PU88_9BACI|nr:ribonuclease M5 [Edaphobacillus lindanitolerans]
MGSDVQIEEIIIVEGKSDTIAVRRAAGADTIETNGSAVSPETLMKIRHAQEKRGVIVFTDPDYPGRRIRAIIEEHVPGVKHAFLPKAQSISANGKKVGIEHATDEDIRAALAAVRTPAGERQEAPVTDAELVRLRLVGHPDARKRRNRLGEILKIGQTNGRSLVKRLAMFRIGRDEFMAAVAAIDEEGENHA